MITMTSNIPVSGFEPAATFNEEGHTPNWLIHILMS